MLDTEVTAKLDQNTTLADGSVTTAKLDGVDYPQVPQRYDPEITSQPQAQAVYTDTNTTFSVSSSAEVFENIAHFTNGKRMVWIFIRRNQRHPQYYRCQCHPA